MGLRSFWAVSATALVFTTLGAVAKDQDKPDEKTKSEDKGEVLFNQTCATCHPGGANLAKPAKTIYGSKQLNSIVSFKKYLEAPAGHMPYYKFIVKDKKLLEALYKYAKSLKKQPIS